MSNVNCQNCKTQFTIEPEDFEFYNKIKVPAPTFCPDCRLQRRLAYRNERSLYQDKCDLCGKVMISMYSPDKQFNVYCRDCWNSDKWDAITYGRDYDFSKPFFQQFHDLLKDVPRISLSAAGTSVNSDFTNFCVNAKNVYLCISAVESENICYSKFINNSKDIFDCLNFKQSERCYESMDGSRNYDCKYLIQSRDCIESAFLFDCVNSQSCFMSSNLRNAKFVFRNKQYSEAEYRELIKSVNMGDYTILSELKAEFTQMMKNCLHKFANIIKSTDSTGNNIENVKQSHDVYDGFDLENSAFTIRVFASKDCYDVFGAGRSELLYDSTATAFDSNNVQFASVAPSNSGAAYIDWCFNSSDIFGCAGLKKKQYHVFNKPYSKEEYWDLKARIIDQMNAMPYKDKAGCIYKFGEFFPIELSPFAYNETAATEYFPLSHDQVTSAGYNWREPDIYPHKVTVQSSGVPNKISETPDEFINEVLGCISCGRAYKIIKQEFDFLRAQNIALPRSCPDCRHKNRVQLRNPLKLWPRECMCQGAASHVHGSSPCSVEFETTYAPGRPETVYCEQCYQSEVI